MSVALEKGVALICQPDFKLNDDGSRYVTGAGRYIVSNEVFKKRFADSPEKTISRHEYDAPRRQQVESIEYRVDGSIETKLKPDPEQWQPGLVRDLATAWLGAKC